MTVGPYRGRAWLITGPDGKLLTDIDTDQIYHNAHLAVTEMSEMGRHAFGNLDGWKDFPSAVKTGDIIVTGGNFGAGSSRQHAVDCFKALGVSCILSGSFGAIYKRNAINSGFPILVIEELDFGSIAHLETIEVDVDAGSMTRADGKRVGSVMRMARVQKDILEAGDLFEYARRL